MAKTITFRELLTKLSNVFKNDMYILDYKYCIAGSESDDRNIGNIICILNPDYIDMMKELYPDDDFWFISDIRKGKDDLETYVSTSFMDSEKIIVRNTRDSLEKEIKNIDTWDNLNLSDEQIKDLFKNGNTIELDVTGKNIPKILINKSMLPLVTEKKIDSLFYHINEPKSKDDLTTFILCYDFDYFQIYYHFLYMNLD